METLKYMIEDSTIAELLGVQNFTNKESAILELVKNAYDAAASQMEIIFDENKITILDNGIGMNADDIKRHWMHIGKSDKKYEIVDDNDNKRVLAGSKGIGRFALSRLGGKVCMHSKKNHSESPSVIWQTDWNTSALKESSDGQLTGTKIDIELLRDKWGKKAITNLADFLSKTYNDDIMKIIIIHEGNPIEVNRYLPTPILGINCLSRIKLQYDSVQKTLMTIIESDEFQNEASKYCPKVDLNLYETVTDIQAELKDEYDLDANEGDMGKYLTALGNFSAEMLFNVVSTATEKDKFLYKYTTLPEGLNGGIILYRNAFSISSYEGKRDWLGLGKRSRRSPAAATHPTGSWRVRENQLTGKVEIDKKYNIVLRDLSNRQGLEEGIYFELFVDIILTGIKEFERYRQDIIRSIDKKNIPEKKTKPTPVIDRFLSDPASVAEMSAQETRQLASEIKLFQKESSESKREKADVEYRYKYDVRILNVLATAGLKASSIAHEMRNDRNSVAENCENIICALKEYGMWKTLTSPENTNKAYKNVPLLLETNRKINGKIVAFMDTMLKEIEKKNFESSMQNINEIFLDLKSVWERDYAWITIIIEMKENTQFSVSEDIIRVIFDNLILNSIQQNDSKNHLNISIVVNEDGDKIIFSYSDDGKGLAKKYSVDPRKILEVHETTRRNGHGLGMWIVNNTTIMSGGEITNIQGQNGFLMEFSIGGKL